MPQLDEFKKFLGDFKSLSSLTAKGATVAPLADYFVKLGPPWPPWAIPPASSLIELLSLACTFHFLRSTVAPKLSRYMIILVIVSIVSFFVYLGLTSYFTFRHPKSGELVVKGFVLKPDVKAVIGADYTPDDALKGSSYDPESVWTRGSITGMRLVLIAAWSLLFVSLSSFLGIFVLVQQRS